jgi:hypothetical protein
MMNNQGRSNKKPRRNSDIEAKSYYRRRKSPRERATDSLTYRSQFSEELAT